MMIDQVIQGDALTVLRTMPDNSIQACVTSPPYYGLRDYGVEGQIGLESSPDEYVARLVEVFREVRRVMKDDSVLWLNLGDCYAGKNGPISQGAREIDKAHATVGALLNGSQRRIGDVPGIRAKNLIGIPWRVAFALQDDGWILRSDVIWHKPNCMPESVKDRPTKSHEYMFLLAKNERYYYDADSVREPSVDNEETFYKKLIKKPHKQVEQYGKSTFARTKVGFQNATYNPLGRNHRTVWSIPTSPYKDAHFAVMPQKLVEPCILSSSKPNDIILDPFSGAATVALVATKLGRRYVGIELNAEYVEMSRKRLMQLPLENIE